MIFNCEKIIDELIEFLKQVRNNKSDVKNISYDSQLEEVYKTLEGTYEQKKYNYQNNF